MSRELVEFRCGHPGCIDVFGSRKDRERKAEWIAARRVCEECYEAEVEARRAAEAEAARAQAEDWELPDLTGSERQIEWAVRIRSGVVAALEHVRLHEAFGDGEDAEAVFEAGVAAFLSRTEARFWIDEMRECEGQAGSDRLIRRCRTAGRKLRDAAGKTGPTVVRPEGREPISTVEILHEPGEIRLKTSRKEEEDFIDEVKDVGFRWAGDHWYLHCVPTPVSLDNVAAGVACEILALGYAVVLPQPTVAELVASGGFEREPVRKLYRSKDGKAFLLRWRKSDDIFDTLKTLPGARWNSPYMRVPATSANEVLDLADRFDFWVSPQAAALARSVDVIEVKGERVVLGLPSSVATASLSGEIHADLRDD